MKLKTLICACCGGYTKGRQWWNQDAGFGLCPKCGEWIIGRMGEPYVSGAYGNRGKYWDVKEKSNASNLPG